MIFVVPHGGGHIDTIPEEEINRVGLLNHPDIKPVFFEEGTGLNLKDRAPQADLFAVHIFGAFNTARFLRDKHQSRAPQHLGDIQYLYTLCAQLDARRKPERGKIRLSLFEQIRRRSFGPARDDGQVDTVSFIYPLLVCHVITGKLRLGHPLRYE